ncbi:gluconokinase [Agromyces protaetiae]|uniref:Gluconokinase n=2 Tax=Agromyces protaetiae TaxID=2509455 RepID=A0A4V0YHJ6_9MICO|nr:gluconokinase [Agromyces protaetiae]
MGPSGSGKSVVGVALAARVGAEFVDGDDLHPEANVAKMSAGVPLDDLDRAPWLRTVGERLRDGGAAGAGGIVIACSALRRRYRDAIREVCPDAVFVELAVPADELHRRMSSREHFMPPSLLDSQIATLEPLEADEEGARVENAGDVDDVAARAAAALAI